MRPKWDSQCFTPPLLGLPVGPTGWATHDLQVRSDVKIRAGSFLIWYRH